MNVRAELHCYHCGYIAARVEGKTETLGQPITETRLTTPPIGPGFRMRTGRPPRCGRCNGPLFLDEIEVIRYAPTVIIPLPPGRRRGRPPKAMAAAAS